MSNVELDLPQVSRKKVDILNSFISIPSSLHIISGNALNEKDINQCQQFFKKESPIAIINEGLLRYLNFDEKRKVARNVHQLLSKYEGVWITCDVTPKKFVTNQDKNMGGFNKNLSSISNRNNASWRFEDTDHAREFFGRVGFVVDSVHPFSEVKEELVSPKKLSLNSSQVDDLLQDAIVVVMKLKN
jgi:O-methyltransferase involved in polyketide biosynthesis